MGLVVKIMLNISGLPIISKYIYIYINMKGLSEDIARYCCFSLIIGENSTNVNR